MWQSRSVYLQVAGKQRRREGKKERDRDREREAEPGSQIPFKITLNYPYFLLGPSPPKGPITSL
jgi:hypothetical protein